MNAFDSKETLYKLIRQQIELENPPEDRSGRTPLQALAEYISGLPPGAPELQMYELVAAQLVTEVPGLTDSQVARLVKFMLSVRFLPIAALQPARTIFSRLKSSNAGSKRADLMWLLRRLGQRFLPREIEQESSVRSARPWLWFDLALTDAPDIAFAAMGELATHPDFFKSMLTRTIHIWRNSQLDFRRFGSELAKYLSPKQMAQWDEYVREFIDTDFVRDIEFEKLAEKVSGKIPYFSTLRASSKIAA